jgi:hypothetical protein
LFISEYGLHVIRTQLVLYSRARTKLFVNWIPWLKAMSNWSLNDLPILNVKKEDIHDISICCEVDLDIYPITEFVFIWIIQLELSFSYLPVRNLLSYFVNFMMNCLHKLVNILTLAKWLLNNQDPTVKG